MSIHPNNLMAALLVAALAAREETHVNTNDVEITDDVRRVMRAVKQHRIDLKNNKITLLESLNLFSEATQGLTYEQRRWVATKSRPTPEEFERGKADDEPKADEPKADTDIDTDAGYGTLDDWLETDQCKAIGEAHEVMVSATTLFEAIHDAGCCDNHRAAAVVGVFRAMLKGAVNEPEHNEAIDTAVEQMFAKITPILRVEYDRSKNDLFERMFGRNAER